VSAPPADRSWFRKFLHPRRGEPGFSYTFDGGYLTEPYLFDPSVFGISPREAQQIDPQQRLLMEVVWEALEDACIPANTLAGRDVGVYVGASSLDYGNLHMADLGSVDRHFMTGNTLSIISNRLSYVFDWHGPSFTVDTACSSSMVALTQAFQALQAGEVDIAVVGGVNLLLAPGSFVGFSRASMLSPTGLCRPFSADGDGYVRSEGSLAIVLVREGLIPHVDSTARARLVAAGTNSDGRTSGISLPSTDGQRSLLERVYGGFGINPDDLAFVEAHGTGTRVGDPAEAQAIGQALGRKRNQPLPIGSIKSNIGHLEPASGLAGVVKSILAMERKRLPRTLHLEKDNPDIDFDSLNLAPAREEVDLTAHGDTMLAGVSSFGFGGSNAHVILQAVVPTAVEPQAVSNARPDMLVLSAASAEVLGRQASLVASLIRSGGQPLETVAAAAAHHRSRMPERLVIPLTDADDVAAKLDEFAAARRASGTGMAHNRALPDGTGLTFVYAGNGAQWAGMGRDAFAKDAVFRDRFHAIDALFAAHAGWSLVERLHDPQLAEKLVETSTAQPLIFAVQSATTAALADYGVAPTNVLGHSVGEVAAAEACGALSMADAVSVIYHRSEHQERARGLGLMAVAASDEETISELLEEWSLAGTAIAAVNSPSSVTLSGPADEIRAFLKRARSKRIAARQLDLDYPFHSALLAPIERPLVRALGRLAPRDGHIPFISTVTGALIDGARLDAQYWWHNVADRVRFKDAVEAAAKLGSQIFVEIGPKPLLKGNVLETLRSLSHRAEVLSAFEGAAEPGSDDPIRMLVARAYASGARGDERRLFGTAPTERVAVPHYPWLHSEFRHEQSAEAVDINGEAARHVLSGSRLTTGSHEWLNLLDPVLIPMLADHVVDGEVVVPAAALAEMALGAGREIWPDGGLALEDFDILHPLVLRRDAIRDGLTRIDVTSKRVEIWSRTRGTAGDGVLHAAGRILPIQAAPHAPPLPDDVLDRTADADAIYEATLACRLDYGPSFRLSGQAVYGDSVMDVKLTPGARPEAGYRSFVLSPLSLDASFHALLFRMWVRDGRARAFLPVRFAALRVYRDDAEVVRAVLVKEKETAQSFKASVSLYGVDGALVARLDGALFRSVVFERREQIVADVRQRWIAASPDSAGTRGAALIAGLKERAAGDTPSAEPALLVEAFSRAIACEALSARLGNKPFDIAVHGASGSKGRVAIEPLLGTLAAAGLASFVKGQWQLKPSGLPPAGTLLATLAADHPGASADIAVCAAIWAQLTASLAGETPVAIKREAIAHAEARSALIAALAETLTETVAALPVARDGQAVRMLVLAQGSAALVGPFLPQLRAGTVELIIGCTDGAQADRARIQYGSVSGIEILDLSATAVGHPAWYDVVVAVAFSLGGAPFRLPEGLSHHLRPDVPVLVLNPSGHTTLATCLQVARSSDGTQGDTPDHHGMAPGDLDRVLASCGRVRGETIALANGLGELVWATARAAATVPSIDPVIVACDDELAGRRWRAAIARAAGDEDESSVTFSAGMEPGALTEAIEAQNPDRPFQIICVIDAATRDRGAETSLPASDRVVRCIGQIAETLSSLTAQKARARLWIVTSGLESRTDNPRSPVAHAVWGYARVAMNEYPAIDLRLVDIAPELSLADATARLYALLGSPGNEREIRLTPRRTEVRRISQGSDPAWAAPVLGGTVLQLPSPGALSRMAWIGRDRRAPADHEIEVEVRATGLNFRDVMLANGLLDDDVLDEGLAGAVLGFEFAGVVVTAGRDVSSVRVGDTVMGFAAEAFASHVTVAADVCVPVPQGLALEAAATIPVAYLTAWYALVETARLTKGEWVLIHGAAGGVGLAAIQVARHLGARVVATVGSPEKEALVSLFGAEKVFNSRSLTFADDIAREIGEIDVVLNSLAGEAMLASLRLLKPFGRFIELGKRDFVANTAMGLRPFRRNLSYFGVDVDQLLVARPTLVVEMMQRVAAAFASGAFLALPYRVFEPEEVEAAFRLMQASGHVGKIVIRPAARPTKRTPVATAFQAGDGVHVVTGGAAGFGFAAAEWLARCGATRIVVASRSGAVPADLGDRLRQLRANSVDIRVMRLDVTDRVDVAACFKRIREDIGPIVGVIHAAAVFEDSLIAMRDDERTARVQRPKVDGAENLDAATRRDQLDYFVLFSSATTVFGNPGQGDYVAANAYLEGVARRRVALGLPALAVAWGAIADVGVLARSPGLAERLERATGMSSMTAQDALAGLGTLLAARQAGRGLAVAVCAPAFGGQVSELPILASPAVAGLMSAAKRESGGGAQALDLLELVQRLGPLGARKEIVAMVAEEVGSILRMPSADIDIERPLNELGMDSLMGLELRMSLEKRLGVDLPLLAITAASSLADLAGRIVAEVSASQDEGGDPGMAPQDKSLMTRHTNADADGKTTVPDAFEATRQGVRRLLQ